MRSEALERHCCFDFFLNKISPWRDANYIFLKFLDIIAHGLTYEIHFTPISELLNLINHNRMKLDSTPLCGHFSHVS